MKTTAKGAALLCALIATTQAGCGGGGDSSAPAPAPITTVDAKALWRSLLTGSRAWNVAGTGTDGASYSGSLSIVAATSLGTLNGQSKETPRITVRISRNGGPSTVAETIVYLDPGTGLVRYLTRQNGDCLEPSSSQEPSTSVSVGQAGALFAGPLFLRCGGGQFARSNATAGYSIEAIEGATFFCFNMTVQSPLGSTGIESLCAALASALTFGDRARIATTANGVTVTMR
jgi:hypothetical protein